MGTENTKTYLNFLSHRGVDVLDVPWDFPCRSKAKGCNFAATRCMFTFGSRVYNPSNLCSKIQWIYIRSSHKKNTSLSVLSHFISHTSAKPESCLCQLSHFLTIQSQKLETHLDVIPATTKVGSKKLPTELQDPCHQCFKFQEKLPVLGKQISAPLVKQNLTPIPFNWRIFHVLSATESGATLDTLSRQRLVSFCQVGWLPRISIKISMIELYKHIKSSSVNIEICGNDRNIDDKSLLRALNDKCVAQHGWLGTPMRNTPIRGFFSTPISWPKRFNWDVDAGVTRRCASKSTPCSAISILHRSQKTTKVWSIFEGSGSTTSQHLIFRQDLEGPPQTSKTSQERNLSVPQWFSAIVGRLVAWWWWIELWKENTMFAKIPQNSFKKWLRPAYDPIPPGMEFLKYTISLSKKPTHPGFVTCLARRESWAAAVWGQPAWRLGTTTK